MTPTSYLYVPGDRMERFERALASGADAVIYDLEDAVTVAAKPDALAAVTAHLRAPANHGIEQWVRINSGDRGQADLRAIAHLPGLAGVVVPKTIRAALDHLDDTAKVRKIALIETAAALFDLQRIATAECIAALAIGEVDLAAELGIEPSPDEHELWPTRMQVVAASAAAGLQGPIGPVHTNLHDANGLRASTTALRRAGFGARQAIHPKQVDVINTMKPSTEELERALGLLQRARSAGGVWIDETGRMIDEAVLRIARRSVARQPAQIRASERRTCSVPGAERSACGSGVATTDDA
jgi:citrate lyase subunit beta / citryl-CoA lyase